MQKKILAVAVAGALTSPLALAQSSVTIYGAFDMSLHSYRISSPAAGGASLSRWDVYNQSSRLGFRGEENLGGGLRAWFQTETNLSEGRNNNPAPFAWAGRNTGVGLTGGWGTVMLGHWDSPYKALGGIFDNGSVGGLPGHRGVLLQNGDTTGSNPNLNCDNVAATATTTQTAFCGQTEGGAANFHRRLSNTVQYWSPKFGGFNFNVAFTANEEKGTTNVFNNNPSLWSATGTYAAGPLNAFIGYESHRGFRDTATTTSTTNTKDRGWIFGIGYNFGVANLQFAYDNMRFGNALGGAGGTANGFKRSDWYIGVGVPLGPTGSALRAGYSKTGGNKGCSAGATAALCGSTTGGNVFTLGYDYALSKRTSIYAAYGRVTNKSGATFNFNSSPNGTTGVAAGVAAGADPSTLGVGVKHSF
jgi:predicted porin